MALYDFNTPFLDGGSNGLPSFMPDFTGSGKSSDVTDILSLQNIGRTSTADYVDFVQNKTAPTKEEEVNEAKEKIENSEALSGDSSVDSSTGTQPTADTDNTGLSYQQAISAWDPRLRRMDAYFIDTSTNNSPSIIPFSSLTAASSFSDMVYMQRKAIADLMQSKASIDTAAIQKITADNEAAIKALEQTGGGNSETVGEKIIPGSAYVPVNYSQYEQDDKYYGVASLMNPYSITKLMGSLQGINNNDKQKYVTANNNYLYDIRDLRRFYDISETNGTIAPDVLSISIPSIRNIIQYANNDRWGRTPYTYQDFVYSKWYGLIPNNRLITLRRYHAPTYDNLQFEGMDITALQNIKADSSTRTPTSAFAPRCTLVTYFGEETDNTLSGLLKFSSGLEWDDAEAKIWDVQGEQGEDPLATIDRMFDGGGGFTGSDLPLINKLIGTGNTVTGKILSFGKFTAAMKTNFGMDLAAFDNMSKIQQDPYGDGTYENRIKGPLNRINKTKKRKEGITYEQSFQIKFSYKARAIGGINPKAAMLDILGNCLEMVSADALFWGGGHRFMIHPQLYPYHDGGWRDNFMKKLYDGKIFGKGGAMDYVLEGVKNFASKGADGKDTGNIWSNLTSHLGDILGQSLGAIGSLISSAGSALFGEGSDNFLSAFGNKVSSNATEDQQKAGEAKLLKIFGNLNNMWHNKVMATTMVPLIKGMNSLLIGDPVGEWHLTVGNPLNPIIVVGNLICEKMDVEFSDELGPDDFPEEMYVTYSLQHGMARDKSAIQSMFNRGMGKYYELPDYIKSTSEFETKVDHYTGGTAFRQPAFESGPAMLSRQMSQNGYKGVSTFQNYKVDAGKENSMNGANANVTLVTKFTPVDSNIAYDFVGSGLMATANNSGTIPIIRSLSINRKYTN